MKRFLGKHKLPVAIGTLAVIAIAVVATLAIRRVISERNRADLALADALDRNEQMILTQAETLLATNPTAAVAIAKSLGPERWRETRAIGMAARATGVARGYPASEFTSMVQLTEDGTHAISAGMDGVIREHDLVRHTTRELLRIAPNLTVLVVDHDRRLVIWDHAYAEVVDLASGAHRALALPTEYVFSIFAHGTSLWLVGDQGAVYAGSIDGPFHRVPVVDDVVVVAPSPDGSWIAYGGSSLWVQHGDEPPLLLLEGRTNLVDWSDDGTRFAAAVLLRTVEVRLTGDFPAVTQDHKGRLALAVAAVRDGVYAGNIGAVFKSTLTNQNGFDIRVSEGAITRLLHGFRGSVIAISGLGPIHVLGEQVTLAISPPASALAALTAAPRSPFIVASTQGTILVWDLSSMIPDALPIERPIGYALAGDHQLIAHFMDKPAEWYDFEKHDVTRLDLGLLPLQVLATEHGDLMALLSPDGLFMYRRGAKASVKIDVAFRFGFFTETEELLVATQTGSIALFSPPDYRRRMLFAHEGEASSLSSHTLGGNWVTATYADGTIWRYNRITQTTESIVMRAPLGWSFVVGGGQVFFVEGSEMKRWAPDGTVHVQATLPRPIRQAFLLDLAHVLVVTDDNAGYDVRLDVPDTVSARFSPGTRVATASLTGEIALTLDNGGTLLATDTATGVRWTLARSSQAPFESPTMTRDGTHVYAIAHDGLLAWRQEVPKTPEATRAFLDALTNARAPTGAAALTWE